ncbi:MAG: ATP-dependent Clp protease adapter protein ClpS [Flavobacterium sp. SCGC AAA160-P02]|nr:MAG: ATP-dependent Clp protease adapter protein ClpS [Flavobacterium sp. SCGC AAA160-P02]
MGSKEKIQEDSHTLEKEVYQHEIILYNDDVNTFDFVIDSLINVCQHTIEQAEQCTWLVHFKGKCTVKTGEIDDLKPRCSKLQSLGLSAELI